MYILQMIPRALQIAFEEDIEFRKSLPRDYLNYMGVAFSDVVMLDLIIPIKPSSTVFHLYLSHFSGLPAEAALPAQSREVDESADDVRTCRWRC